MAYQEEKTERRNEIVTYDGGGVRGYASLSMLSELMESTRRPQSRSSSPKTSSASNHDPEVGTPNTAVHSYKDRILNTGDRRYQCTLEDPASMLNPFQNHNKRKTRTHSQAASRLGTIISIGVAAASASIIERYKSHYKTPNHRTTDKSLKFNQYATPPDWKDRIRIFFIDKSSACIAQSESNIIESTPRNKHTRDILRNISHYLPNRDPLTNPPPLLFLLAVLAFALAITHFRHLHRRDRYQDGIIICFITLGILAATQAEDVLLAAKGFVVWSIVAALLLSFCLHRLMGDRWKVSANDNESMRFGIATEIPKEKQGGSITCGTELT